MDKPRSGYDHEWVSRQPEHAMNLCMLHTGVHLNLKSFCIKDSFLTSLPSSLCTALDPVAPLKKCLTPW